MIKNIFSYKVSVNETILMNTETLMNMSKYPSLPNLYFLPSKMAKLQSLEKYLL